jgi:hypothetical protein
MKKCTKCGLEKELTEFHQSKKGISGICKVCTNLRSWLHKSQDKEGNAAKDRNWKILHSRRYWSRNVRNKHITGGGRSKKFDVRFSVGELMEIAYRTDSCPSCGKHLDWGYGTKGQKAQHNSPSLDRLNNEIVMTMDNIQIICYQCNVGKISQTNEQFYAHCWNIALLHPECQPLTELD